MEEKTLILTICLMALVTYIPRALPGILFSKIALPDWFLKWLKFVPPAILSSLLAKEIVNFQSNNLNINIIYLLGSLVAYFLAKKGLNYILSLGIGLLCVILLRFLNL